MWIWNCVEGLYAFLPKSLQKMCGISLWSCWVFWWYHSYICSMMLYIYIYMCMCIYIIMCIYNYIYIIIISYYFILRCFSLLFLRSGATVHLQHLPEVFAALATASSVLVALPHPGPQSAFEPQVTQVTGPSHTSKQITKPIPGSFRDHESWIMRHDSRWIMRKCTQII